MTKEKTENNQMGMQDKQPEKKDIAKAYEKYAKQFTPKPK